MIVNKLLLIEDDLGDAILFKELMEGARCTASVDVAPRLADALNYLLSDSYDIIISDMNLPDSSGFSTIRKILEASPDAPIIVLTGNDNEELGLEAVKIGAQDYLVKSDLDVRVLKKAVTYACERKKLEMDLKKTKDLYEQQARIDFLTGIYNRMMFSELLKAEIQRSVRHDAPVSMIMFDLDHFKHVNDTYGHIIGDHVLKETAKIVSETIRGNDIFSRWGGEEFIVMTPACDREQASILAEKLRLVIERYDFGNGLKATASFGVAQYAADDTQDSFIVRTDEAMYTSKKNGRNRVTVL